MENETLGIVFALLCLIMTAVNDFIFKLFARKERSKGIFCTIIGLFWMAALASTLTVMSCFMLSLISYSPPPSTSVK